MSLTFSKLWDSCCPHTSKSVQRGDEALDAEIRSDKADAENAGEKHAKGKYPIRARADQNGVRCSSH